MFDTTEIKNFLKTLSPKERIIVNIIAFIGEGLTQTKAITFVSYLGLGLKLKSVEYNNVIELLKERNLIDVYSSGGKKYNIINLQYGHYILSELAKNPREFKRFMNVMRDLYPPKSTWGYFNNDFIQVLARDVKIHLYSDNMQEARKIYQYYKDIQSKNNHYEMFNYFFRILMNDTGGDMLCSFNSSFIKKCIEEFFTNQDVLPEHYLCIDNSTIKYLGKQFDIDDQYIYKLLAHKLFAGLIDDVNDLEKYIKTDEYKNYTHAIKAFLIDGKWNDVIKYHEKALRSQEDNKKKKQFDPIGDSIYIFTIMATQQHIAMPKIDAYEKSLKQYRKPVWEILLEKHITSVQIDKYDMRRAAIARNSSITDELLSGIVLTWCFKDEDELSRTISPLLENLESQNFKMCTWNIMVAVENYTNIKFKHENIKFVTPLHKMLKKQEDWEIALDKLNSISYIHKQTMAAAEERLIWKFTMENQILTDINPVIQKRNKAGKWSKGRVAALKRVANLEFKFLTEQDKRIANYINKERVGYNYQDEYFLNIEKSIHEFAEHPLLFLDDSISSHIELIEGKLEITILQNNEEYEMLINVPSVICSINTPPVYKESPTRLRFLKLTETDKRILQTFENTNTINIPSEAKKNLQKTISTIADKIVVHSESDIHVEDDHSIDSQNVKSDSNIVIQINPLNDGFKLSIGVKPFTTFGMLQPIGKGIKTLFETYQDKRYVTKRDFNEENSRFENLVNEIPELDEAISSGVVYFESPEECLYILEILEPAVSNELITIEWPDGGAIKVSSASNTNNFKLKVDKKKDWFAIKGEYQISEDKVIGFKELLEKLENQSLNYIKISENDFIKITDDFRKKINTLNTLIDTTKSGDSRIHKLAISNFASIFENNEEIIYCKEWNDAISKIDTLIDFKPEVPSTFQGELRNYQHDGYKWLSTLAEWGVGACLADDMGLGKTIQALALLLNKATKGPSIVVAPASVTSNWYNEAKRFTPTLNPIQLREFDRDQIINLKEHDLLITSYGLLNTTIAEISKVEWNVLVFDEAQALKNIGTKRSKVARQVHSDFRLLTTGTPLENNLGELWNLFDIINPGLLGSAKMFKSKFMAPIEKDGSNVVQRTLRELISPFILRRLKTNVLDELPDKTEITLTVEMNEAERSFYETLRRRAIDRTSQILESEEKNGSKHLKVLAEITKLRQLCCNPLLLDENTKIASSKLEQFKLLVHELKDNNHKALVFSQFVSHLKIIRAYLDKENISYQYLDGSTPMKKREQAVKEFQAGSSDFFLISLKAGGTGLNLTAADYVIHMDPWWNPAVENQASDRAHRIGQKRPVTVYRIIVKNSIEEKIIELHEFKTELANSLLQDTDKTAKMNINDLVRIIKEQ
jgi:SNF2 family DNA or RNA helicase